MPRRLAPLALSNGSQGFNRFDGEARKNQVVDGQNIIADDGDVRRREAFVSVGHGVPFILPQGSTRSYLLQRIDDTVDTEILQDGTELNLPLIIEGGVESICGFMVGNLKTQFDGFRLGRIAGDTVASGHRTLQGQYYDGSDWVNAWTLDLTQRNVGGIVTPLLRSWGTVSWHTPRFSGDWPLAELEGETAYWFRVVLLDDDGEIANLPDPGEGNDWQILHPGIQTFELGPVSTLQPSHARRRRYMVVGSDRRPRGSELGGAIGVWEGRPRGQPLELGLHQDWLAGLLGAGDYPQWTEDGTPVGSTVPFGSAGHFFPESAGFDYDDDEQRIQWMALFVDLDPDEGTSTASVIDIPTSQLPPPSSDRAYDHWVLVVTNVEGDGETAPAQNAQAQVWQSEEDVGAGMTRLYVWPPLSAAPDADTRFELRRPGARARFKGHDFDAYPIRLGLSFMGSDPGIIVEESGMAEWEPKISESDGPDDTSAVHAEILTPARWALDPGSGWRMVNDALTQLLYLTNGRSGILEFDGDILRRAEADTTSALALAVAGVPVDAARNAPSALRVVGATLDREPPRPKFIESFGAALVCANLPDGPQRLQWSRPYTFGVWHLKDVSVLPDTSGLEISGMRAMHDRLYVWTAASLYAYSPDLVAAEGAAPDVVSPSQGFSSDRGVTVASFDGQPALVGPGPDGIRVCNGVELRQALDEWKRVIPGGVNEKRLADAPGVFWADRELAIWALPPVGSGTNTEILVWHIGRKTWWRWTYDLGLTALAVWTDSSGRQRLMGGTADGFIVTLMDALEDDGEPVVGRMRSPAVQPGEGAEVSVSSLHLTMGVLGPQSINVRVFMDSRGRPHHDGIAYLDSGDEAWPVTLADSTAPTAADATLAAPHERTIRVNLRPGAVAHQVQYEVESATRWRLTAASVELRPMSSRGRR